jgi:sulfate adenylyltransferase subunit 1
MANRTHPAEDLGVLRFLTCGSVDDGKSTLIGRLLLDTRTLLTDTLATLERNARERGLAQVDLSLLTDGLVAEREQGITIDVAYRYFATARRKFIIADSPGHVQYTRNMVTAASTADAAVLLVDARKGVLPQTRRHATVAGLLGVRHLVVAVNKLDLVGWSRSRYEEIVAEFRAWLANEPSLHVAVDFLPMSAITGANVVERGAELSWFDGPTLIGLLERLPAHERDARAPLRLPVQWVCRPSQSDFRGLAGRIECGTVRAGDGIVVVASGARSRVRSILLGGRELAIAGPGQSVMLVLEDELDVSRGDLLVRADEAAPASLREFEAVACWLDGAPLDPRREILLRQCASETRARVRAVTARLDIERLSWEPFEGAVRANDIVRLALETQRPIPADDYERFRATGSFVLVDGTSNGTVAAGMFQR